MPSASGTGSKPLLSYAIQRIFGFIYHCYVTDREHFSMKEKVKWQNGKKATETIENKMKRIQIGINEMSNPDSFTGC